MSTGRVKWFSSEKGYGFIECDDGHGDVFVHISELKKSGLETLPPGNRVSFTRVASTKRQGQFQAAGVALLPS